MTWILLLFPLMEMQSYSRVNTVESGNLLLTSPHVTDQFLMTMSLEFHESKPSVLTVFHCEFETALMSKLVIVTFCEYATKVCL